MRWTSGDGITLNVLAPSMPFLADTGDDVNENSIVVMLRYRNYRELFMGDAGEASAGTTRSAIRRRRRSRHGSTQVPASYEPIGAEQFH